MQSPSSTEATFVIGQIQALPVTVDCPIKATRQDPGLSQVLQYVKSGWPAKTSEEYKPFYSKQQELSIEGHCLLWGNQVVVPKKLRSRIIDELHRSHPRITQMKSLTQSYLWWPGLDSHLE